MTERARLRLLAGDLPTALEAAAQFVSVQGPVATVWRPPRRLPYPAAIDAGSDDLTTSEARRLARVLAAALDGAEPAFLTLDGTGRGHDAIAISASLRLFSHCIIAPARPDRGSVTRDGQQWVRDGPTWRPAAPNYAASLAELGLPVRLCRPGEAAPEGISLWDAENGADLAQIVAEGRCLAGPLLWCGTPALAHALAGGFPVPSPPLPSPILALIGSDHPASVAQLSAAWARVRRLENGGPEEAARITRLLRRDGAVAVAPVVVPTASRVEADRRVEQCFGTLIANLEPPGTLLVSGAEALRMICATLRAERLDVDGAVEPGLPAAILRGGAWDGLRIVAKAGDHGDPALLGRLMVKPVT